MALFPVTPNPSKLPSWLISNGHISATAHSIHLCSAHLAVIFAMAQLSCFKICYALYKSTFYLLTCSLSLPT